MSRYAWSRVRPGLIRIAGAVALLMIANGCAPAPAAELPIITGSPAVGSALQALVGTWIVQPAEVHFKWGRCDASTGPCEVVGDDSPTYIPVAADVDKFLVVTVTGKNQVGSSSQRAKRVGPVVDSGSAGPVASLAVPSGTVVVTGPDGSRVTAALANTSGLPPLPATKRFPFGPISITIGGVTSTEPIVVTVGLPEPIDSVAKLLNGNWKSFGPAGAGSTLTGGQLSGDGRTVTLRLIDGGRGDSDGMANGEIVDPVLLGQTQVLVYEGVDTQTNCTGFFNPSPVEVCGASFEVPIRFLLGGDCNADDSEFVRTPVSFSPGDPFSTVGTCWFKSEGGWFSSTTTGELFDCGRAAITPYTPAGEFDGYEFDWNFTVYTQRLALKLGAGKTNASVSGTGNFVRSVTGGSAGSVNFRKSAFTASKVSTTYPPGAQPCNWFNT